MYYRIARRASGYRTTFDVRVDNLTGEDEFIVTVFENIGLRDAVLDLGCGDGSFTVRLGHRSRQVIGLDVSREMLRYAVNNLADSSPTTSTPRPARDRMSALSTGRRASDAGDDREPTPRRS